MDLVWTWCTVGRTVTRSTDGRRSDGRFVAAYQLSAGWAGRQQVQGRDDARILPFWVVVARRLSDEQVTSCQTYVEWVKQIEQVLSNAEGARALRACDA